MLVTGTNGKTTTTLMIARALAALGEVACNDTGANMPDGLVAALAHKPRARLAVLEVDEGYLPVVLPDVAPAMVVLLNLSRDQMDRVAEVRRTEYALRTALSRSAATVVTNCDDVLTTSAALGAPNAVWISAGTSWRGDSTSCPRCGSPVAAAAAEGWRCDCGLQRPAPHWTFCRNSDLVGTDGQQVRLRSGLPGPINALNAAVAVAAAVSLGVPMASAVAGVATVTEVDGRYRVLAYRERAVRLLLAKNPAGWEQTLLILRSSSDPVVLVVNAREADGRDLSWLWDVGFEPLRGRQVLVCGERAIDLAVRLDYAEVDHQIVPDPLDGITKVPPGPVDLVANYTAFRDVARRLARVR